MAYCRTMMKEENMTDEQIMYLIREGESQHASILFDRYERKIYSFFRYMGIIFQDAEDLTVEVFERVIKGAGSFDETRAFRPWLFQIARNRMTDHFRSQAKNSYVGIEQFEFTAEEHDHQLQDQLQKLQQGLIQLDPAERELLLMAKYKGLKYRDISIQMQVSEGVIKTRIHRIIRKLKNIIDQS